MRPDFGRFDGLDGRGPQAVGSGGETAVGSLREQRILRLGTAAGLGLAVLGQAYFATRPDYVWDGVLFYAVGTAILVWTARRAGVDPLAEAPADSPPIPERSGWPAGRWRLGILAAGLLALAGALVLVVGRRPPATYWDAFGLWVLGILLVVVSAIERVPRPGREAGLVAALTMLGLGLRFYRLDSVPYIIDGDAAAHGLEAIHVLEGAISSPFVTGWGALPTLFFFSQAATIEVFGPNALGLRFMSALLGGLSVPLSYLLTRDLFGSRLIGMVSALFLATCAVEMHFSRIGKNDIADVFFVLLVLLCLHRAVRTGKAGWFAVTGVALGLSQYFYHGGRLIPVLALVFLVAEFVRRLQIVVRAGPGLALCGLTAGLVVAPLAYHFITHPQDLMARLVLVGVFQSGWFDREVAAGRRPAEILFTQFARSFLGFNFFPDTAPHYRPGTPLLGFIPGIFFVIGLGFAVSGLRRPANLVTVAWFVLAVFFGNVLTTDPPYSPRLLISIPAVAMLLAVGLVQAVRLATAALEWPGEYLWLVSIAVVATAGAADLDWYFRLFGQQKYHWDGNTVLAVVAAEFINAHQPGARTYFLGAPRVYFGHPSLQWVAHRPPGEDIAKPLGSGAEVPARPERPLLFIGVPERAGEFQFIREAYASGEFSWLRDPNGRQHLAWAYVVRR